MVISMHTVQIRNENKERYEGDIKRGVYKKPDLSILAIQHFVRLHRWIKGLAL